MATATGLQLTDMCRSEHVDGQQRPVLNQKLGQLQQLAGAAQGGYDAEQEALTRKAPVGSFLNVCGAACVNAMCGRGRSSTAVDQRLQQADGACGGVHRDDDRNYRSGLV
jgi:hypothetical protein